MFLIKITDWVTVPASHVRIQVRSGGHSQGQESNNGHDHFKIQFKGHANVHGHFNGRSSGDDVGDGHGYSHGHGHFCGQVSCYTHGHGNNSEDDGYGCVHGHGRSDFNGHDDGEDDGHIDSHSHGHVNGYGHGYRLCSRSWSLYISTKTNVHVSQFLIPESGCHVTRPNREPLPVAMNTIVAVFVTYI